MGFAALHAVPIVALFAACQVDAPPPLAPNAAAPSADARTASPLPAPPASALAAPGPAALACTGDSGCGSHRCNTSAGKCAFPCMTDADCVAGASCVRGAVATCLVKR